MHMLAGARMVDPTFVQAGCSIMRDAAAHIVLPSKLGTTGVPIAAKALRESTARVLCV